MRLFPRLTQMIALAAFSLAVLGPRASYACDLSEHTLLTDIAIAEYNECVPQKINPIVAGVIVAAVLQEDLNLPRKWIAFSHFYRPDRKIKMTWRYDSGTRVNYLTEEISLLKPLMLVTSHRIDDSLGNMIHQIQDMSSPPHTVPVMHAMNDGYENFEGIPDPAPDSAGGKCAFLKDTHVLEPGYPRMILDRVSNSTLRAIRGPVDVYENGFPIRATWQAFWKESGTDEFGAYGWTGNTFGQTSFTADGRSYEMPLEAYQAFKASRMRDAIEGTKALLNWERLAIYGS